MKRFKFPLFIAAILVAMATTFAFTDNPAPKEKFSTVYHYVGPYTNAGVKIPANWVEESVGDCPATGSLPCGIIYEGTRQNFDIMVGGFANLAAATSASDYRFD